MKEWIQGDKKVSWRNYIIHKTIINSPYFAMKGELAFV